MFVRRCLLVLLMVVLCQDMGLFGPAGHKCRFGAFAGNETQTLVVTVSAEPGIGQELIKELVKASQDASLRLTDSKGSPLRGMDDEDKAPAKLGPRKRPTLTPSPTANPPEKGRRCPREQPPTSHAPPKKEPSEAEVKDDAVIGTDKVACTAQCANQDGVEEVVNVCDDGCKAKETAKTEAKALKGFQEVVDGGDATAGEAAKDGEEMKKSEESCRPCKKSNICGGIDKVEGAEAAEAAGGTFPPGSDVPAGAKICSGEEKPGDPCGATREKRNGSDPCRPAEGKEAARVAAAGTVAGTASNAAGETVNAEVKVVEEPQCRISLEEETQVNSDCRSCSARVLPTGGVKLSCFQCEHRPSDQTCYFARKMDPVFKVSARFFEMAELMAKKNSSALRVLDK